jgi:hypothetical protein
MGYIGLHSSPALFQEKVEYIDGLGKTYAGASRTSYQSYSIFSLVKCRDCFVVLVRINKKLRIVEIKIGTTQLCTLLNDNINNQMERYFNLFLNYPHERQVRRPSHLQKFHTHSALI